MYRIVFDPKSCAWIIQLLKFGFVWVTLQGKDFPNYKSATDYVDQIDLDNVYRNYANSAVRHIMDGAR